MTITTSTLRPGLLVNLSTSVRGNVKYERVELDTDEAHAKWETTRHIADLDENVRATKARSKVRSLVTSVCCDSAFGLLCPESDRDVLDAAVEQAQSVVDEFNIEASLSRLVLRVMVGKIAQDDVTAIKRINSEVRDLMIEMQAGIENLDVKRIRDAATAAKEVGGMLTPQAQANVQIAIETARSAARQIVKAGEAAALEVDTLAIRKIADQRTMFLDLSDQVEISRPQAEARAIDLAPEENNNAV